MTSQQTSLEADKFKLLVNMRRTISCIFSAQATAQNDKLYKWWWKNKPNDNLERLFSKSMELYALPDFESWNTNTLVSQIFTLVVKQVIGKGRCQRELEPYNIQLIQTERAVNVQELRLAIKRFIKAILTCEINNVNNLHEICFQFWDIATHSGITLDQLFLLTTAEISLEEFREKNGWWVKVCDNPAELKVGEYLIKWGNLSDLERVSNWIHYCDFLPSDPEYVEKIKAKIASLYKQFNYDALAQNGSHPLYALGLV